MKDPQPQQLAMIEDKGNEETNLFVWMLEFYGPTILYIYALNWAAFFLVYISFPVFVGTNRWIISKMVFSNIIRWPPFLDLGTPSSFGLDGVTNFRIDSDPGVSLGAWHIPAAPKNASSSQKQDQDDEQKQDQDDEKKQIEDDCQSQSAQSNSMASAERIILYLHGNSGTRGSRSRIELYKVLVEAGFHLLTFDYRGYGDSTGAPCEEGLARDAMAAWRHLRTAGVDASKILLWGHSLGTGVAARLARQLSDEGDPPRGVVLESAFNTLRDAARHHPIALPYSFLPGFDKFSTQILEQRGIRFDSEAQLAAASPPVLMMHARDDFIVPFKLGHRLFTAVQEARASQGQSHVFFKAFAARLRYGHNHIHNAAELPGMIQDFYAGKYENLRYM